MRDEDLRKILLVKSVEEADAEGTLLPAADRAAAGREAMRAVPGGSSEALLAARAGLLYERVVSRHPFVANVMALLDRTPAIGIAAAALAFAVGASLPILDGPRLINVLAIPVVGVVLWNVAVYAALAYAFVRRRPPGAARAWFAALVARPAERLATASRVFNAPLAGALQAFVAKWLEGARPLLLARAATAFHVAAAALGLGIIASLYARGIVFDYRAAWESTFIDAHTARAVLAIAYGPASWLTGIPLPTVAELEAVRWRAGAAGGENAARWIHLIAATTLLFVVLPRLALALLARARARSLDARAPVPASFEPYYRAAFASIEGAVPRASAVVLPYAYELSPAAVAKLVPWVQSRAGGPVDVVAAEGVPYGEEERYLETFAERGAAKADIVVLPFSLAATPEAENHGLVLAGARDRLAALRPGAHLRIVVDEAPYAQRMAASPERLAERRELWRAFVRAHGLEAEFASLAP